MGFAKGIVETLDFILGKQSEVYTMCAYVDNEFDIKKEIDVILKKLHQDDELIVFVDILGGSVASEFSLTIKDTRIHIVAGVNFPMLLDMIMNNSEDINLLIQHGMKTGKESIVYLNDYFKNTISNSKEDEL